MGRCYDESHQIETPILLLYIVIIFIIIAIILYLTGCTQIDPLKKTCITTCKQSKATLIGYQNTTNGLYCTCNNNGTTTLKRGEQ